MGKLRGQRNRDQDRYWHERRKLRQGGMVAEQVLECIFCARLLASNEAHFSNGGDAFCEPCGTERGLISQMRVRGADVLATLTAIDGLTYQDGVSGRSGRSRGTVAGYGMKGSDRLSGRQGDRDQGLVGLCGQSAALMAFQRELDREQRRVSNFAAGLQRDIARAIDIELYREARRADREARILQRDIARAIDQKRYACNRLFERLVFWLRRDSSTPKAEIASCACAIAGISRCDTILEIGFRLGMGVVAAAKFAKVTVREAKSWSWEQREMLRRQWEGDVAVMRFEDAARTIAGVQERIYRRQHPRRKADVPRKLTDDQAHTIRVRYASGRESLAGLGREFGVTGGYVMMIVTGAVYKSAGGPLHRPKTDRYGADLYAAAS